MIQPAFRRILLLSAAIFCGVLPFPARAASTPPVRITAQIDSSSSRVTLAGSRSPRAKAANDIGVLAPETRLQGITLVFNRSTTQQADLLGLIAAQQNPASPLYHQWLNPDQFAARFGVADADLSKVQAWLQQQGFAINGVSRSRDRIIFSGTAAQAAATFGAPLHQYKSGTEISYAPSADLTIPSALAGVVAAVDNLSSFRLHPRAIVNNAKLNPKFTSSQSGNHFLTPGDVATIYDVNAAYNSGYTGSNQSIAIAGQSFIYNADIADFQSASGLTPRAPTMVVVPNSGTPTEYQGGDEAESDLDVEYSSTIARGATIFFVYTGNNGNYGVFDSLQYAIDEEIAPIVSISYGGCELNLGSSEYASLDAILAQAAAQGQTVVAASGDDGSTDCYDEGTSATLTSVSVDFPASSEYVTGVGGTEFPTADIQAGNNTYFTAAGSTDVISSAVSYIPEEAWNDDSTNGLASGGGGVSIFTPLPSWQTGVPGIPTGGFYRFVPDIALDASNANAPYLFCSSDYDATGITGSCSNGFRDQNDVDLTTAGGTSFAAPIFAGMVAILNQATNSTGQGVINTSLYSMASNATIYALAFHDTTSGGNYCPSYICVAPATTDYATTTGYDQATGLGSIDLNNLIAHFPATATSPQLSSTTTVTAATLTPAAGANDTITISVTNTGQAAGTPTGSVALTVDGTVLTPPLVLVDGQATYTFNSAVLGNHIINVVYSGDTTYAPSSSSISLNVGANGFTLAVPNITISAGNGVTDNVSITSVNAYSGDLTFLLSAPETEYLPDICYSVNDSQPVAVGTAGATAVLAIYTSLAACNAAGLVSPTGIHFFKPSSTAHAAATQPARPSPLHPLPLAASLAGLLGLGLLSKRARKLRKLQSMLAITFLALAGLGLSGCGYSGTTNPITQSGGVQAPGTYTLTLTGTDTVNVSLSSSATFTLTIQ